MSKFLAQSAIPVGHSCSSAFSDVVQRELVKIWKNRIITKAWYTQGVFCSNVRYTNCTSWQGKHRLFQSPIFKYINST